MRAVRRRVLRAAREVPTGFEPATATSKNPRPSARENGQGVGAGASCSTRLSYGTSCERDQRDANPHPSDRQPDALPIEPWLRGVVRRRCVGPVPAHGGSRVSVRTPVRPADRRRTTVPRVLRVLCVLRVLPFPVRRLSNSVVRAGAGGRRNAPRLAVVAGGAHAARSRSRRCARYVMRAHGPLPAVPWSCSSPARVPAHMPPTIAPWRASPCGSRRASPGAVERCGCEVMAWSAEREERWSSRGIARRRTNRCRKRGSRAADAPPAATSVAAG